MKPILFFVCIFLCVALRVQAQTNLAQQLTVQPGSYISLVNYTDPMDGTSYQAVGQTFKSLATTTISTIEFYLEGFNAAGTANMELYSCSNQTTWTSLLGTKTAIAINGVGWISVDVSSLNIAVVAGNYYGFKLLPQDPLDAGVGIASSAYADGTGWTGGGFNGFDHPFKVYSLITLPVKMSLFTALKQNNTIQLHWRTSSEQNSGSFMVEKSSDGSNWKELGGLPAAGNSSAVINYGIVDNNPTEGINYYRIRQTDLDGKSSYSEIRTVKFLSDAPAFLVVANPVINGVLQLQVSEETILSLYKADGSLVWKKLMAKGFQNCPLDRMSRGLYFLKGKNRTQKIWVD